MYQCATVLDVARQPLWRYVKGRHRSCDDTWSSATNLKKYYYLFPISSETPRGDTSTVAVSDVSPQGLLRNVKYSDRQINMEKYELLLNYIKYVITICSSMLSKVLRSRAKSGLFDCCSTELNSSVWFIYC